MEPESRIGRRIREVRIGRKMSLRVAGELAGMSATNLSRIERGLVGAERKATVEAIARALRVPATELTGQPFAPSTPGAVHGQLAVDALRAVLRDVELGELEARGERPALDELACAVERATEAREHCDYAALGELVPPLLADLYGHVLTGSEAAREPLVRTLMLAFRLAKDLGHRDVAWAVAGSLNEQTNAIGDPAWVGVAQFVRAEAMTGTDARSRALALVQRTADEIEAEQSAGAVAEAYGLLRLSAALQSAILGDVPAVGDYVGEASAAARRTGEGNFAGQHFGPRNIDVWRVGLAVEVGDVAAVPSIARQVDVEAIPSQGRRAAFWVDLGRGLSLQRDRAGEAVAAFRSAELLAPHTTYADPYVRETVGDLLRRARRDAGGRELRSMASRFGLIESAN